MGCKADGAAQGYTILGGIVLAYFAIQMIIGGLNTFSGGDINGLVVLIQGIALILMVVLSFDASGYVSWKVGLGRWANPEPFLLFLGSCQSS
jgi:hypothetical protein